MKIGILGGSFDPPHIGHLYVAKSLIKHKLCHKIILMPVFKHPFGKPITDAKHRLAMTKLLALHAVIPAKLVLDDDRGAGIQQSTRFPIRSGMTKTRTASKLSEKKSIEVSDIEIKTNRISYTIETLNTLKTKFPKDNFVWIMGDDQIENFRKWKGWKEIIKKFGLIIVPRATYPPLRSHGFSFDFTQDQPATIRGVYADHLQGLPTSEVAKQRLRLLGGEIRNVTVLDKKIFHPLDISSSKIREKVKGGVKIHGLVPEEVEKYIIRHKLYK